MLKLGFSETRSNSKLVRCVLGLPYSNTMSHCARQRLEYFETTFSEKIAFSRSERIKRYFCSTSEYFLSLIRSPRSFLPRSLYVSLTNLSSFNPSLPPGFTFLFLGTLSCWFQIEFFTDVKDM